MNSEDSPASGEPQRRPAKLERDGITGVFCSLYLESLSSRMKGLAGDIVVSGIGVTVEWSHLFDVLPLYFAQRIDIHQGDSVEQPL